MCTGRNWKTLTYSCLSNGEVDKPYGLRFSVAADEFYWSSKIGRVFDNAVLVMFHWTLNNNFSFLC